MKILCFASIIMIASPAIYGKMGMPAFSNLRGAMYPQVYAFDNIVRNGPWKIEYCEVFSRLVEDSAGLRYSLR